MIPYSHLIQLLSSELVSILVCEPCHGEVSSDRPPWQWVERLGEKAIKLVWVWWSTLVLTFFCNVNEKALLLTENMKKSGHPGHPSPARGLPRDFVTWRYWTRLWARCNEGTEFSLLWMNEFLIKQEAKILVSKLLDKSTWQTISWSWWWLAATRFVAKLRLDSPRSSPFRIRLTWMWLMTMTMVMDMVVIFFVTCILTDKLIKSNLI